MRAVLQRASADQLWAVQAANILCEVFKEDQHALRVNTADLVCLVGMREASGIDVASFCMSTKIARLEGTEHVASVREENDRADLEKQILEKNCEDALRKHAGVLTCSKCKSRHIAINQKQSRAADEGMTLYCMCECGHAWKM